MSDKLLTVEVVYAMPEQQVLHSLQVIQGTDVKEAITQSTVLNQFPEIDLNINVVGIFSKKVSLNTVLKDGDRIEIYRPLFVDPKEARRLRAKS